jgi:hypothetical protein
MIEVKPSRLGGLKHSHWANARGNYPAVSKSSPLAFVLSKELIANDPVGFLVLAPIGMNLSSDFGR